MKIRTKKTYLVAFVVLGFFILGYGIARLTNEPTDTKGNPHHCKKDDERPVCESLWERTSDDPVAFFTFWLVVVTAGLVGGTLIQMYFLIRADETARSASETAKRAAKATEDTVDRMGETADKQLRPYINIVQWDFHWMNPPKEPDKLDWWRLTYTWKNAGQTPAHNVHARVSSSFFVTNDSPEGIDFPDIGEYDTQAGACSPGQEVRSRARIEVDDLVRSWQGDGVVYCWGWIEYDGLQSGVRHRSEFCNRIVIGRDPTQIESLPFFSTNIATAFNAMDGLCLHQPKTA